MRDEDSDENSDDVEPVVEYKRLSSPHLAKIVINDRITSTCVISRERLALGTKSGGFFLLSIIPDDYQGYTTYPHSRAVRDISCDASGLCVGFCGDDGKVTVKFALFSQETVSPELATHPLYSSNFTSQYNCALFSLALDPRFNEVSSSFHRVVLGGSDGRVIIVTYKKRSSVQNYVIHSGEGPILKLEWHKDLIVWFDSTGVKIYSVSKNRKILYIPFSIVPPTPVGNPTLQWIDQWTLVAAVGSTLKVASLTIPDGQSNAIKAAQVLFIINLDASDIICGVLPFHFLPSGDSLPQLSVISTSKNSPYRVLHQILEISTEEVKICDDVDVEISVSDGFCALVTNDLLKRDKLFLVTDTELIEIHRVPTEQYTSWLLDHERYRDALTVASQESEALLHRVASLAMLNLFEIRSFETAASLISLLNLKTAEGWIECLEAFDAHGAMQFAVQCIPPPSKSSELPQDVYSLILAKLAENPSLLKIVLSEWDISNIACDLLLENLKSGTTNTLNHSIFVKDAFLCVAMINRAKGEIKNSFYWYLRAGSTEIFHLLTEPSNLNFSEYAIQEAPALFEISVSLAASYFGQLSELPIPELTQYMRSNPRNFHFYLKELLYNNPSRTTKFHQHQIASFAIFEPEELPKAIKLLSVYDPGQALEDVKKAIALWKSKLQEKKTSESNLQILPELVGLFEAQCALLVDLKSYKEAIICSLNDLKDVSNALLIANSAQKEGSQMMNFLLKSVQRDPLLFDSIIPVLLDQNSNLIAQGDADTTSIIIQFLLRVPLDKVLLSTGINGTLLSFLQTFSARQRWKCAALDFQKEVVSRMKELILEERQAAVCINERTLKCQICKSDALPSLSEDVTTLVVWSCGHSAHKVCAEPSKGQCYICSKYRSLESACGS